MRIECNVAGITFRNKDKIFESLRPEGVVKFERDPFVHPTDPTQSDPLAVKVFYQGTLLGYVKRDSFAQETLADYPDITEGFVIGYGYATGSGESLRFNDDHEGRLTAVRFAILQGEDDVVMDEDNNYIVNGKPYSRVTKVLKFIEPEPDNMGLERWKIENFPTFKAYLDYMSKASREGRAMHNMVESALKTGQSDMQLPIGFDNFCKRFKVEVIALEQMIMDDDLAVAGRYDLKCWVTDRGERKCVIVDWKSAKSPRAKHVIQCGYYAKVDGEATEGWIVCFGADNKQGYSLRKVTDIDKQYRLMTLACGIRNEITG